jgi:1-acyl-sn-glycerol-3-phosphate acyltransferase
VQPIDKKLPRVNRTVTIRFGDPIAPARYLDRGDDHLALREMTDEVMYEICQLSGYEYVDTYATKTPEDLPTPKVHVATFDELRTPAQVAS